MSENTIVTGLEQVEMPRAVRRRAGIAAAAAGVWGACWLFTVPEEMRDVVFTGIALLIAAAAVADFPAAWCFFLLILPVVHILGSLFGIAQFTFVRLQLVALAAIFPMSAAGRRLPRDVVCEPGFVAFALFIAVNLVSAARVSSPEAVLRAVTYGEPLAFAVITYCIVRRRPQHSNAIERVLVLSGAAVAALGVVEILAQESIFNLLNIRLAGVDVNSHAYLEIDRFGLGGRIMSTIGQPVYAALYFAVWLIVAVHHVVTRASAGRNALLFALSLLGAAVLVATGSRAPLLALVPAGAVAAAFGRWRSKASVMVATAAALVTLITVLAAPGLVPYLRASVNLEERTTENVNVLTRIELTNRLLDYFRESPVWGKGPGTIQHAALAGEREFEGLSGLENQYAMILADGGLVAGAAYALFMVASLRTAWRASRSRDRDLSGTGLMGLVLLVFYFVAVATATCLTQVPNFVLMAVYGAVAARLAASQVDVGRV